MTEKLSSHAPVILSSAALTSATAAAISFCIAFALFGIFKAIPFDQIIGRAAPGALLTSCGAFLGAYPYAAGLAAKGEIE